jgi:hypothetical protein
MENNGMNFGRAGLMTIVVIIASWGCQNTPAQAQTAPSPVHAPGKTDSQDAARRKIMESDRWKMTQRQLNEWLSVQTIYSPDEVAVMRSDLASRVAKMSPDELEKLMKDMEDRLVVLTSPEAADARQWLEQFLAVARNPEEQLGMKRPDVMNMTASQIRVEMQRLEQKRASRLQAQANFDRKREFQGQVSRDALATRQTARAPVSNRSNWPANTPQPRNQNTQRRDPLPAPFRPPVYTVSPWGTPIFW